MERENFEKKCQDMVDRIAKELTELCDGYDDKIEELEEKLEEIENKEPDEDNYESEDDFNNDFSAWETEKEEIEDEIEEYKEKTLYNYFDDYLDITYMVDSSKNYRSARIWIAIGGPGICVNTETSTVDLHWGATEKTAYLPYYVRDKIDEIFEKEYNWL